MKMRAALPPADGPEPLLLPRDRCRRESPGSLKVRVFATRDSFMIYWLKEEEEGGAEEKFLLSPTPGFLGG